MRRYRNQIVAGLLFISVVLIAVVLLTGAEALADNLHDFPLWLFVPVFLLKCLNWALRYGEWRYFLGVIGVRTVRGLSERPTPSPTGPYVVRELDSAVLWLCGLAMAVSPGKLAEVLKALVLKNLTGIGFSRGAPVVLLERLVDGLAIVPLSTAALFIAGNSLDTGEISMAYVRAVLVGVTVTLGIGMVLIQFKPLAYRLIDLVRGWPVIGRFHPVLRNLYDSTYDLIKLHHLVRTIPLAVGAYLCDCVGFFLILRGLGLPASWTLFGQGSFILGFSVLVASISALPGGAGGRELAIGTMLAGVAGLSKADAGTGTFLIALFQLWVGVVVGLILIALFRGMLFPPALDDEIAAYQAARSAPPA